MSFPPTLRLAVPCRSSSAFAKKPPSIWALNGIAKTNGLGRVHKDRGDAEYKTEQGGKFTYREMLDKHLPAYQHYHACRECFLGDIVSCEEMKNFNAIELPLSAGIGEFRYIQSIPTNDPPARNSFSVPTGLPLKSHQKFMVRLGSVAKISRVLTLTVTECSLIL